MTPRRRLPAVSFVGAGRLARALLPALDAAGYPVVVVASRRLASARQACREIRDVTATTDLARAAREAELLLLAVPDREVAGVARELVAHFELKRQRLGQGYLLNNSTAATWTYFGTCPTFD